LGVLELTWFVQIYTRYRTAVRRWRWRSFLYLALAGAGSAFLVWVFWHTAQDLEPSRAPAPSAARPVPRAQPPPAQPASSRQPAATNAVRIAVSTNLVMRTNQNPLLATAVVLTNRAEAVPALRVPTNTFEAQLALARRGISSGPIDGMLGSQTRAALRVFQRGEGLPVSGRLDAASRARLAFTPPALTSYVVTSSDVAELRPLSPTWLGKSRQDRLGFETVLELVAERAQAHPQLIRRLNPYIDWTAASPGLRVVVPCTARPDVEGKAAKVAISLRARALQAYDAAGRLLAHFPCSIARRVDKRPVGSLRVMVIIRDPSYTFNPDVFPESAEGRRLKRKLLLPPGPNNPVGTAWIGLDRPGYGMHGTPRPEEVGRTESHGCFRLANWNAVTILKMVDVGTPVEVIP